MNTSPTMPRNLKDVGSHDLDSRSLGLRKTIVRMLEASRRGHLGSAFSLVEILRVLYDDVLHYDSKNPKWSDRDRCILSKGHWLPCPVYNPCR